LENDFSNVNTPGSGTNRQQSRGTRFAAELRGDTAALMQGSQRLRAAFLANCSDWDYYPA